LGIGYLTVTGKKDNFIDWNWLESLPRMQGAGSIRVPDQAWHQPP